MSYIGIDLGTQSIKVILYDHRKQIIVQKASRALELNKTEVRGRAEQWPQDWIKGLKESFKECLQDVDRTKIRGIGVSGQQHGLITLDKENEVIRPAKLWCDTESADQASRLSEVAGYTVPSGFTGPKVLWLKENEPKNYEKINKVLLPHDYLNFWLTGKHIMEPGDQSGSGYFDIKNKCFDQNVMHWIDPKLKDWVAELSGPNEFIGKIRPELADELDLPKDVYVAPGGGDNQQSALGCGCVSQGPSGISLGTSGVLFSYSDKAVIDKDGTIAPFCDSTGGWLPLICTINCTLVPQAVQNMLKHGQANLKSEDVDMWSHSNLSKLAEQDSAPGCGGVNFIPYLAGERTPNWPHAQGAVTGLGVGSMTPGLLYRAAIEGATYSVLAGKEKMETFGLKTNELRIVGGGAKNKLWCQIVADAFQLPTYVPSETELAALGGALQACAIDQGEEVAKYIDKEKPIKYEQVFEPQQKHKQAYQDALARHKKFGAALYQE